MNSNIASNLLGVFEKAVEHHDDELSTQHDLGALAYEAHGITGGTNVWAELLNSPMVAQAIFALLSGIVAKITAPKPPVVVAPPVVPDDTPETTPETGPTDSRPPRIVEIHLARIRAVLSGKRFPKDDPNVDPNPDGAFNYATAVTFEAALLDADGEIIDTGAHGGVGHTHTTRFFCESPDGSVGQIGPGSGDKLVTLGSSTIGAGGANYESTNGTNATFRFGFADVAVKGEFSVWAEEDGVKSNVLVSRVI